MVGELDSGGSGGGSTDTSISLEQYGTSQKADSLVDKFYKNNKSFSAVPNVSNWSELVRRMGGKRAVIQEIQRSPWAGAGDAKWVRNQSFGMKNNPKNKKNPDQKNQNTKGSDGDMVKVAAVVIGLVVLVAGVVGR